MRPLRLYWWRGEGANDASKQNFGDYLSPLIVGMLASRPVEFATVQKADMLAIGTILKRERQARFLGFPRRLHIWGGGAGTADERFSSRHYYHAVRGKLTRAQIIDLGSRRPALGDPGLLAPLYTEGRPAPQKKFKIGVVPHFVDQALPTVSELGKRRGVCLINVYDPVDSVIEQIRSCHFILSSSMHGLIISDAYGIPNRRVIFSDKIKSSSKFEDYYSAFDMGEPSPLTAAAVLDAGFEIESLGEDYGRMGLSDVQSKLVAVFPRL